MIRKARVESRLSSNFASQWILFSPPSDGDRNGKAALLQPDPMKSFEAVHKSWEHAPSVWGVCKGRRCRLMFCTGSKFGYLESLSHSLQ